MKAVKTVIQDWDAFIAYLATQPLCQWSIQKQREIDTGSRAPGGKSSIHAPPKNDNAELAAALSSMA